MSPWFGGKGYEFMTMGQSDRTGTGRREALRLAAQLAIRLLCGAALFLLIAAFVEAYWSSMTYTGATVKYAVGGGLWLLVLAYLGFAGRGAHAPD